MKLCNFENYFYWFYHIEFNVDMYDMKRRNKLNTPMTQIQNKFFLSFFNFYISLLFLLRLSYVQTQNDQGVLEKYFIMNKAAFANSSSSYLMIFYLFIALIVIGFIQTKILKIFTNIIHLLSSKWSVTLDDASRLCACNEIILWKSIFKCCFVLPVYL